LGRRIALIGILGGIMDSLFGSPSLFFGMRRLIVKDFAREKQIILAESESQNAEYVLDFGCGVGQFSALFTPQRYVGVDIERKYVAYAKKNFEGEFLLTGKGAQLSLQKGAFDVILAVDLFHHLSDEDSHVVLEEFKRVLTGSGRIVVIDALARESQPNLLGRLLVMLDRGSFFRGQEEFTELFSQHFGISKHYITESGPYSMAVFVLAARS
jgi:SAM-dependent methyltransferase